MPFADPKKGIEYSRQYRAENKEEINRKQREKYAAAKETAQAKKERIKQQKRESKQCVKQRKQLEA
jgi:hypothetical protein